MPESQCINRFSLRKPFQKFLTVQNKKVICNFDNTYECFVSFEEKHCLVKSFCFSLLLTV